MCGASVHLPKQKALCHQWQTRKVMDITSVVALVVAAVVLGGIFWLAVYSRKQNQKHTKQTSIKPPESQSKRGGPHEVS